MTNDLQADENAAIETATVSPGPAGTPEEAVQQGDLIALVGTTTRLFEECLLPNGALVEAPVHLPFYPAGARDAFRCRPGILVAFAISSMDALGRNVRAPLLRWIRDRAAGFGDDGLLRAAYAVHGPVLDARHDLIGSGLLLWATSSRPERASNEIAQEVTRGIASALAVRWDGHGFRHHGATAGVIRAAELAAAEVGLRAASAALEIREWARVADGLREERDEAIRTLPDETGAVTPENRADLVEAHLALAWPFSETGGSEQQRLARLAEQAVGLHDRADHNPDDPVGASAHLTGLRPAELFWLATARALTGETGDADGYYRLALSLADNDGHFPEAADHQALEPSPKPALLAHLLFLQAADALGYVQKVPKSGYTGRRRST